MHQEYQGLVREVRNDVCHFAEVTIKHSFTSSVSILNSIPDEVIESKYEVNCKTMPAWVECAMNSITKTLSKMHISGKFELVKLRGSLVDTTEEDINLACTRALESLHNHIR